MKVLSLFSGVGGFDLGLERAGMQTVFQCEWDKHATKILERHWPDVPRWGDVSTLTGAHVLQHAPVVDVVAWGSPCQDLSLAGKRAGLGGERSSLFHEGVRIIKEMREITNGKYPRMSVWENVAGALSSGNGADFGQVLYEMDEAGACFSEWRLLDAQYFGVPQRRRRVFLVSVFDPATAARCPDPLLPVSESVRRDTAESAATREKPARTSTQSLASGRDIANTIPAELYHKSTIVAARIAEGPVNTLSAKMGTGGNNTPMVAYPIQDGRDMEKHQNGLGIGDDESPSYTLDQTGAQAVAIGIQGNVIGRQHHNGPAGKGHTEEGDPMFTLTSTDVHAVLEPTMAVRRLTPVECERLMGWPDGWTDGQADTHRYKQCGNGVASPVAQWIGQQLMELD